MSYSICIKFWKISEIVFVTRLHNRQPDWLKKSKQNKTKLKAVFSHGDKLYNLSSHYVSTHRRDHEWKLGEFYRVKFSFGWVWWSCQQNADHIKREDKVSSREETLSSLFMWSAFCWHDHQTHPNENFTLYTRLAFYDVFTRSCYNGQ